MRDVDGDFGARGKNSLAVIGKGRVDESAFAVVKRCSAGPGATFQDIDKIAGANAEAGTQQFFDFRICSHPYTSIKAREHSFSRRR